MSNIRDRIVEHIKVRAKDLVPNDHNFRKHPLRQRQALAASFQEIGFARSVLAYRTPEGKLKLIDGHLRTEMDPEMEVTVEVLDVNEEEANKLLLTIDPIGALAQTDHQIHDRLRALAQTDSAALNDLWTATANDFKALEDLREPRAVEPEPPKHMIVIECVDEKEQVARLRQLKGLGWECRAMTS